MYKQIRIDLCREANSYYDTEPQTLGDMLILFVVVRCAKNLTFTEQILQMLFTFREALRRSGSKRSS